MLTRVLSLTLFLLSHNTYSASRDIKVSSKFSNSDYAIIKNDITLLKNLNFKHPVKKDFLTLLGLKNQKNLNLYNWVSERIGYIVEDSFLSRTNVLLFRVLRKEEKNVEYPFPDELPVNSGLYQLTSSELFDQNIELTNGTSASTIMTNVGASLYLAGKYENILYSIKFSEKKFSLFREKVIISSPRIGVVMADKGYLDTRLHFPGYPINSKSNHLSRIATLIHEARHSDGHGVGLSFIHAECPRNHTYQYMRACDENLNGPYSIGGYAYLELGKLCDKECSNIEKEIFKLKAIDSFSRIMPIRSDGHPSRAIKTAPEYIDLSKIKL